MGPLFLIIFIIFVTVVLVLHRRAGGSPRHRSGGDSGGVGFLPFGDCSHPNPPHHHTPSDGSSHHHTHHHDTVVRTTAVSMAVDITAVDSTEAVVVDIIDRAIISNGRLLIYDRAKQIAARKS